ncbi:MAG: mechanosensitive ion channel [Planctomycetes bacterium]|nr:mechanosensitive ion channel [Planctomycetota bacterium]
MNDFFTSQFPNLWPAIGLAIGFPLILLILSELIYSLDRRGKPLARTLRTFRNLVVPALAVVLFVVYLVKSPSEGTLVRVAETAFWIVLLYALLGIVNDLVFGLASQNTWCERVPKLFRDLTRAGLVAIGAMVICHRVWGGEHQGALTALGVGSVVIGLALQEPLGNIVSGLMLLFERPLNVGDWVTADGVTGRVVEINWRSAHIETPTRELRVVRNISLYKGALSNLSRPTFVRTEVIEVGFGYNDPPNRVKEIMLDLLTTTPGVLSDPAPAVRTLNYADFSVIYRLIFSVARQEELAVTRDRIMTRLWYAAKRGGLTIPYPIQMEYSPSESPTPDAPTPRELLRNQPRFLPAIRDDSSAPPRTIDYAAGEPLHAPSSRFEGIGLILTGTASISTANATGESVCVGEMNAGECFGSHFTAESTGDDVQIRANSDVTVMLFDDKSMELLLNQSPSLAAEIGDTIESRRQAILAARKNDPA